VWLVPLKKKKKKKKEEERKKEKKKERFVVGPFMATFSSTFFFL
jgi:hypothetical protein